MHGDDTLERFEHAHSGGPGAIEPLDHFVLVEPVDDETETNAGLIIPASSDSSCLSGVVVAIGEDVHGVAPGGEPKRLIDRRELIARITD
jgi:hypothetical protein